MIKPVKPEELPRLRLWLTNGGFAKNAKQLNIEYADGTAFFKLVKKLYPKVSGTIQPLIQTNADTFKLKLKNWELLNEKVLTKLGLKLERTVLIRLVNGSPPGMIEALLHAIMLRYEAKKIQKISSLSLSLSTESEDSLTISCVNTLFKDGIRPQINDSTTPKEIKEGCSNNDSLQQVGDRRQETSVDSPSSSESGKCIDSPSSSESGKYSSSSSTSRCTFAHQRNSRMSCATKVGDCPTSKSNVHTKGRIKALSCSKLKVGDSSTSSKCITNGRTNFSCKSTNNDNGNTKSNDRESINAKQRQMQCEQLKTQSVDIKKQNRRFTITSSKCITNGRTNFSCKSSNNDNGNTKSNGRESINAKQRQMQCEQLKTQAVDIEKQNRRLTNFAKLEAIGIYFVQVVAVLALKNAIGV